MPRSKRKSKERSQAGLKGSHAVSVVLAKAKVLTGSSVDEVAAIQEIKDAEDSWSELGAIVPPYNPEGLMDMFELSNSLRQNVDAYKENIDGCGHQFKPRIDLDKEGVEDRIREAILLERYFQAVDDADAKRDEGQDISDDDIEVDIEITDAEVKEKINDLKAQIQQQMLLSKAWFDNCGLSNEKPMSFIDLRKKKREDQEVIGHAAWELRRDNRGRLRRISYVPGYTVYPVKDDGERVTVEETERIPPIGIRTFITERFFRKYVQKVIDKTIYFKSFGDPRIVSRRTGKTYKDEKELEKAESHTDKAHELAYFDVSSPKTPAGVPRWIGNLIAVMGSRAADEVNYLLFDHKSVPPGIFFITGGELGEPAKKKLKEFISDDLQGRDAFHKIMILELPAVETRPGDTPQLPEIKWQSLMADQHTDASFSGYDQANRNKLGSSFRQHPMLRGETTAEINRAIAWAILKFTDQQVYAPKRDSFDWWVNQNLMPEIGCNMILFASNSPVTTTPEEIADIAEVLSKYGALVPNELREIASKVLNTEYEPIKEDWASKLPAILTLAGFTPGAVPSEQPPQGEQQQQIARLQLRLAELGIKLSEMKGLSITDVLPDLIGDGGSEGHEVVGDMET